jgi:hypothetical protein
MSHSVPFFVYSNAQPLVCPPSTFVDYYISSLSRRQALSHQQYTIPLRRCRHLPQLRHRNRRRFRRHQKKAKTDASRITGRDAASLGAQPLFSSALRGSLLPPPRQTVARTPPHRCRHAIVTPCSHARRSRQSPFQPPPPIRTSFSP